jgi:3-hydroxybutyryl-CoA dehydrogenase
MRIGIVGSGIMGAGIAQVATTSGHEVVLRSRKQDAALATQARLEKDLAKLVGKGRLSAEARDEAMSRFSATDDLGELSGCDLVLESIVEDLEVKRQLLAELGELCQGSAVLATNTSTLPVVELAAASGRPDKVCGIHFFNPAPVMSLVELVRPLTASDETMDVARSFALSCGKQVVDVADRAGFVVNALLFPYLNNAIKLAERGTATIEDIDTAMKGGCGFPMGPFALLDLVGLDTSLAILEALHAEFGDPGFAPAPALRRLVAAGRLGRKTGSGFLSYA